MFTQRIWNRFEEIYEDKDGDVFGCEHCVKCLDVDQWWEWNKPDDRPE